MVWELGRVEVGWARGIESIEVRPTGDILGRIWESELENLKDSRMAVASQQTGSYAIFS